MNEYVRELENEAKSILAEKFGRRPTSEENPVLELVTTLLEDGVGGVRDIPNSTLTTDEWLRWNRLLLANPRLVRETASALLLEEEFPLPQTERALLDWAVWLLLSTLDRL